MRRHWLFGVGMFLVLAAAAWAQTGVDGVIGSEWDGAIILDPDDSPSSQMEMTRWGARSDGSFLYWFAEIGDGKTWADFQVEGAQMYPALWGDFDASTATFLRDAGYDNCADKDKLEWAQNHRGIDLNIEWGTDMGGTVNYWGYWNGSTPGDVSVVQPGGADATVAILGSVIEVAIRISGSSNDLSDGLAGTGIPPNTLGDYWMVAVGVQGYIPDSINWGYDVGTPIPVAKDPSLKPVLPGDANLDGAVSSADYTIWADNYGTGNNWRQGDFNLDNSVTSADYTIWADNYGLMASPPVPEPATMGLFAAVLATMAVRRKGGMD